MDEKHKVLQWVTGNYDGGHFFFHLFLRPRDPANGISYRWKYSSELVFMLHTRAAVFNLWVMTPMSVDGPFTGLAYQTFTL